METSGLSGRSRARSTTRRALVARCLPLILALVVVATPWAPAAATPTAERGMLPLTPQGGLDAPPTSASSPPASLPDDPLLASQWGVAGDPGAAILSAWNLTRGDRSVRVAVIDSGIEAGHEDLAGLGPSYDPIDGDAVAQDDCGHGTHVAGIIGAVSGNGHGVAGVANVTLLPVRVLADEGQGCRGSFDALADGLRWAADNDADIVALSLGCPAPCYDQGVADAVRYATEHGTLIVAAAGNTTGEPVQFPANLPEVIAVGAIGSDGAWAPYSAVGPEVDLIAPGTAVVSTYLSNEYAGMSGTSMAAPHVAGAAALALSITNLTNHELRELLTSTARDLGLEADHQGAGALDAAALVTAAREQAPTPTPSPTEPGTPASGGENVHPSGSLEQIGPGAPSAEELSPLARALASWFLSLRGES